MRFVGRYLVRYLVKIGSDTAAANFGAARLEVDASDGSVNPTNFFGTVWMTRAVVPHMRRQGAGRLINMGSLLGFLPMPYMAVYAATKHAVEGYSESLDHELRTRGVRVLVVEPGVTKTRFDANLLEPDFKLEVYREVRSSLAKRWQEMLADGDQPAAVADVVLGAATAVRPKLRYRSVTSRACGCFAGLRRLA